MSTTSRQATDYVGVAVVFTWRVGQVRCKPLVEQRARSTHVYIVILRVHDPLVMGREMISYDVL